MPDDQDSHHGHQGAAGVTQWGWFFWLAIPASTGSFGLWFVALKKGGATRTSGYLFLAPLFTVGLSLWLVNRQPAAHRF